jgi:Domain of unknown function (DUF4203)
MNTVANSILNTLSGFSFFIGIVECFFGYRMLKLVLGVTGFIIGGLLCFRIVYQTMGSHPVIAILAGLVGGTIGSSLMIVFFVFGLFILCAALGFLIGGAISTLIIGSANPAISIPLAIVGGFVTISKHKSVIIISTSFIGAYLIVFSVGKFIGIPNTLFGFQQFNGLREIGGQFIVMLLICILVGILGIFVQHKYTATSAGDSAANSERY